MKHYPSEDTGIELLPVWGPSYKRRRSIFVKVMTGLLGLAVGYCGAYALFYAGWIGWLAATEAFRGVKIDWVQNLLNGLDWPVLPALPAGVIFGTLLLIAMHRRLSRQEIDRFHR